MAIASRRIVDTCVRFGLPVLAAILLDAQASAAPPDGIDSGSPVAQWYHSLRTPDSKSSCCDVSDCRHLPTRVGPNGYEVFAGGKWVSVPPDKILARHDNPTGEPVVCWSPYLGVMCFIEGTGV